MFEVIVIIAIVLAAVIAVVLVLAVRKPDTFIIQRSTVVKAPPEKIFALINDFHQWRKWSPWEDRDPALKRSYEGAASGEGAVYRWEGNKAVGTGRMEILEVSASSKIIIKLDFLKPFEAHNTAEFTMLPQAETTNVNWAMRGSSPFLHRVMQVFMDFDSLVGKDFESGLANLKKHAES
jgi:uncharacterized protein YndB with AHSA1/START domain